MTPEQIERNRAFIRDLRANEKKAMGTMRTPDGGRCCMCVAYDTALTLGGEFKGALTGCLPPADMSEFYGWPRNAMGNANPLLDYGKMTETAANFNDGSDCPELTHAEIADAFEATFPEIKVTP